MPVSEIVCGLPLALSLTDSVALKLAAVVGVNVIVMVQLDPAARLEPQVLPSPKAPVTEILTISSAPVPLLVNITGCD